MKQKYYYQKGMCEALCYQSLNPVLYISPSEGQPYKKQSMACTAIENGKCKNHNECQLLTDAPDSVPYNDYLLCSSKLK